MARGRNDTIIRNGIMNPPGYECFYLLECVDTMKSQCSLVVDPRVKPEDDDCRGGWLEKAGTLPSMKHCQRADNRPYLS